MWDIINQSKVHNDYKAEYIEGILCVDFERLKQVLKEELDFNDNEDSVCYYIEPNGTLKGINGTATLRAALMDMIIENVERPFLTVSKKPTGM